MTTSASTNQAFPWSLPQQRAWDALQHKRFFKLICGASFTKAETITRLAWIYAQAGMDCIDIAANSDAIDAVEAAYNALPDEAPRPLVMVSIALDDDPHFRKIELITSSCILCGACLPTCPTDAIDMNSEMLSIEEPLCYGCGRCEVVCPTSALIMHPFHTNDKLEPVMTHPLVGAVEIHATHADPFQWERFLNEHGHWLTNKLVSLCFPAASLPRERWLDFLAVFEQWNKAYNVPWMLQIDGKPMSGTDEQNASWPALNAAQSVGDAMTWPELVPITISGGVNQWTPLWLAEPLFHLIAGAGVGTMARRYLWDFLDGWDYVMPGPKGHSAIQAARGLVRAFQVERHMSYNEINLLMESAESA